MANLISVNNLIPWVHESNILVMDVFGDKLSHRFCVSPDVPFCRCVLGNTTILAEFASEEEINRFFAQGQSLATPSSSWQTIGSSQSRMDQSHPFPSRAPEPNQWNSSDLHSSSLWGGPNYSSSLWGTPSGTEAGRISSPSPISSFLPVDHLTGGGESMWTACQSNRRGEGSVEKYQ